MMEIKSKIARLILLVLFVLILLAIFAAFASVANAQWITWGYNYGTCTTCQGGSCKPSQSPSVERKAEEAVSSQEEEESPVETNTEALTSLFEGQDADKWEAAIKEVCERRHLEYSVLLKKHPWKIACRETWSGTFAGCTYSVGNGRVSKVEIVSANCYNVEAVRRHEASHVITFIFEPNSSLFTHEGMSQIQERAGMEKSYLIRAGNQLRTNEDLLDWVQASSYDGAYRVYSYSYATFRYLEKVGGCWWLEGFVNEVNRTCNFESALKRWYGLSGKQLTTNVRELINTNKTKTIVKEK